MTLTVSDLTPEQKRQLLQLVRRQLGEDNYRQLVDRLGEEGPVQAFLSCLPEGLRNQPAVQAPSRALSRPPVKKKSTEPWPLGIAVALLGAVAGGYLAYSLLPGFWWLVAACVTPHSPSRAHRTRPR